MGEGIECGEWTCACDRCYKGEFEYAEVASGKRHPMDIPYAHMHLVQRQPRIVQVGHRTWMPGE